MRRFRLLTVFAVVLTLPAYGMAGYAQQTHTDSRVGGGAAQWSDCCPGKTGAKTSCKVAMGGGASKTFGCGACKAGSCSKSTQVYEAIGSGAMTFVEAPQSIQTERISAYRAHGPYGLWRPPD